MPCTICGVPQLTNLQELRILSPSGLHGGGLKALTALQRLTSLDLGMCEFSVLVRAATIQNGTLRNISGEQTLWRFSSTVSVLSRTPVAGGLTARVGLWTRLSRHAWYLCASPVVVHDKNV